MPKISARTFPLKAKPRMGTVWRVVETQAKAATREITGSQEEQHRLEALLDAFKPAPPDDCKTLHYLLATPFRYPPLPYGSRFGSDNSRGIFYASKKVETALAEAAVYLWLFRAGPTDLGPMAIIRDHRTAFSIGLRARRALSLDDEDYTPYRAAIVRKHNWQDTQTIGEILRDADIDFFWYPSARIDGMNCAVLNPRSFSTNSPKAFTSWQLRLDSNTCWFEYNDRVFEFHIEQFQSRGQIPHPIN